MWRVSRRVKEQCEGVSSTLGRGGRAHSVCKIQIFSVQFLRWNSLSIIKPFPPTPLWKIFWEGQIRDSRRGSNYVWFFLDDCKDFGGMTKYKLFACTGSRKQNQSKGSVKQTKLQMANFDFFSPWSFGLSFLFMPEEKSLVRYFSFFFFFTVIWDIFIWWNNIGNIVIW